MGELVAVIVLFAIPAGILVGVIHMISEIWKWWRNRRETALESSYRQRMQLTELDHRRMREAHRRRQQVEAAKVKHAQIQAKGRNLQLAFIQLPSAPDAQRLLSWTKQCVDLPQSFRRRQFGRLQELLKEQIPRWIASGVDRDQLESDLREIVANLGIAKFEADYMVDAMNPRELSSSPSDAEAFAGQLAEVQSDHQRRIQTIEAMENLDLHQQWKPPPVWQSGLEMWSIHETGMHLLFLGICESIVFEIENWAVKRKLNTSLGKQLLYLTAKIEKFHLSWCKVNQYKGDKLGGWISENYMAHSRLFAWYYSCLHVLAEDTPYEPPDKPRGRWNMLENKAWLRSRNLPVNGNAEELKERVTSNFNLPEAPPTGAPLTHVVDVVLTFWSMVSHLMGMKEGNTLTANVSARLIRVFLTAVYDLDELMAVPMDRKIPMWLSQYNFLCLLNLPEQIEKLGPIRNRWDGSIRGERFLQKAKPNVRSTRLKNWAENLMLNLLRQRELFVLREGKNRLAKLEVVGDDDNLSEGSDDENGGRPDLAAFYTYRCRTDVVRAREDEEPISVVLTQEEGQGPKAFVCYRGRHRSIMTCEMERFGTPTYYFGMHYHQFKLKSFESDHDEPLASIKIVCYGLLLPILKSGEETYAMVDSNWRVLNDHGQLVHPHVYLSANTH